MIAVGAERRAWLQRRPSCRGGASDQPSGFVGEAWCTGSGEASDEVNGRQRRSSSVIGLLAKHVQHNVWREIELVEEEGVGMDDLDAERVENVRRVVADVGSDYGVGPTA